MNRIGRILLIICLFGCVNLSKAEKSKKENYSADVIIYGGTSAAVTAAVQVIKQGKSVLVVSPDIHLGGLSAGGLGFTDTGDKSVIGGLAREFYHRVYMHYDSPEAWKWQKKDEYGNKGQGTPAMDGNERTMWIFEPHVAETIFEEFVKENNVKIYRNEWLDRGKGVLKKDGNIVTITTLSGKSFSGKMFIDATYEGDLMAAAGVKYHVGREANSEYGEQWNGIQAEVFQHGHYFKKNVSPFKVEGDPKSGLLPYVTDEKIGKNGEGDHKIQAYCFRMCLSANANNRIPFAKPAGYKASNYELLARVYKAGWTETFDKYDPIPNKKTDTNNHGPFSTDFIGQNYDYPEATYARRKQIIKEHELYQKGLMYYLTNDPAVPADVRAKMSEYGLPKDEFKDNGGWPHQIYVREARRMIGVDVMTEGHTLGTKPVNNSVGMGSYSLDAHNAQRYVKADGYVQNEGDIGVHPKKPYAISYESIIPKKAECENLLVPVCLSSSHIAYGSIRMEPVFMILGQSAASAAVQAIEDKKAVQDVDYGQLKVQLLKDKQKLEL